MVPKKRKTVPEPLQPIVNLAVYLLSQAWTQGCPEGLKPAQQSTDSTRTVLSRPGGLLPLAAISRRGAAKQLFSTYLAKHASRFSTYLAFLPTWLSTIGQPISWPVCKLAHLGALAVVCLKAPTVLFLCLPLQKALFNFRQ